MKLFFLSLMVLSAVSGYNWFKNRPKEVKKHTIKGSHQRPINLGDPDEEDNKGPIEEDAPSNASSTAIASDTLTASETASITASEPAVIASATEEVPPEPVPAKFEDPVMAAFDSLGSSTFDPSPFAQLVAEANKVNPVIDETGPKVKLTKLLNAPFGGILETPEGLNLIIGGRLHPVDKDFQGKKIKNIESKWIKLEDSEGFWIMPKKGVTVDVATNGTITLLEDAFERIQIQ